MTNSTDDQNLLAADRFAFRIASSLSAGSNDLPYEVTERLRAARVQAVARRKGAAAQPQLASQGGGEALGLVMLGWRGRPLWGQIIGAVALAVLAVGLFVIDGVQSEQRAQELAEIDAAILTDDLPPSAYADPGFAHFVKLNMGPRP